MRPVGRVAIGFAFAAVLGWGRSAHAAAPVSVWFRATDGCPSGADFLERVSKHGVDGRLAGVGDHIDFVVTLGQRDGESSGTLERQSSGGTVALRELHASSCQAVAEALALTLALTVEPDGDPAARTATAAVAPAPNTPPSVTPAPRAAPPPAAVLPTEPHRAEDVASQSGTKRSRWSVGLDATVGTVVRGAPLWGAAAFAELQATRGFEPAVRLSLTAGAASDPVPNVRLNLFTARIDGCPLFVGERLAAGACAAFELGRLGASSSATGGRADANLWSALWGIVRLRYRPARSSFSAEIQGGVSVPLTRYRLTGDVPPQTLAEVNAVGFGLAAGGAVSWQ